MEVKIVGESNLTVSEGNPASFTCSLWCVAPSIACIGVSPTWTKQGGIGDNNIPDGAEISTRHTNTTLSFSSTAAGDTGAYICRGMTQNFTSSDVAHLTVNGNYVFQLSLIFNLITKIFMNFLYVFAAVPVTMVIPAVVSSMPNQTATLHCTSSMPQAMCSFYKENSTTVIVTGEGNVDLHILSAQSSDAGSYVCRCTNSEGTSEDSGMIVCKCVCVCMSVCMCLCVYVFVCMCVCCMCVYTCKYMCICDHADLQ